MPACRVVFSLFVNSVAAFVVAMCCAVMAGSLTTTAAAQEVTLLHEGITLNADLEFAPGKTMTDGMVLMTHGGLAHRDMETIIYLRRLLKEAGYNTLAINLSLGLDNRHGMYDCQQTHRHRNDDAVAEIAAWMAWLQGQGAQQVILFGHSRGGAQTALYAAERDSDRVEAVVLLAPAIADNTSAATYAQRYGKPLAPLLQKARQLVHDGQGDSVLEQIGLLTCRETHATANSFVAYYGQDPRLDTPYLIPRIHKPVFVAVAGSDAVVKNLDQKIASLVDGQQVQMKVIDGADHMFRDLYADDAVESIVEFLQVLNE